MHENRETDSILADIFQNLFDVAPGDLSEDTRRGTLLRWDSLGHLELLKSLQSTFGIKISPEQALDLMTVGDIKQLLSVSRR